MKKLIVMLVLISLVYSNVSHADYFVTYKKSSKEVIDISKDNSCAMPKGTYDKIKVSGNYRKLKLLYSPRFYYFKNSKLILNNSKIQEDMKTQQNKANIHQEELMVDQRMRKIAMDSIIAGGYVFQYITEEQE